MEKDEVILISESEQFLKVTQKNLLSENKNVKIINEIKYKNEKEIYIDKKALYILHCSEKFSQNINNIKEILVNKEINLICISPKLELDIKNANKFIDKIRLSDKPSMIEYKVFIKILKEKIEEFFIKPIAEANHIKGYEKIIVIGASTGGSEAVEKILMELPKDCPPIIVAIHMPEKFTAIYAKKLNEKCNMIVKEVKNGDYIKEGIVSIAAGGKQNWVEKRGEKLVIFCDIQETTNVYAPSIDILFKSIAKHNGSKTVAAILTGMGNDGAEGLLKIKQAGGFTIGQDEATSLIYGMPKEAYNIGGVNIQAPLDKIDKLIMEKIKK